MKYSVHCQNPPCVRFVVECEANSPDDAKKIVREKHPSSKILHVTMDVNLKRKFDIGMKYQVIYQRPKKKGFATQKATFLKIEDAVY